MECGQNVCGPPNIEGKSLSLGRGQSLHCSPQTSPQPRGYINWGLLGRFNPRGLPEAALKPPPRLPELCWGNINF